jgi:hypothetical protein
MTTRNYRLGKSALEPVPYQSSLKVKIEHNFPSIVTYADTKTGREVGRVYKCENGKWWLATVYKNNWRPFEVFTKYGGFLFLNRLNRTHHEQIQRAR